MRSAIGRRLVALTIPDAAVLVLAAAFWSWKSMHGPAAGFLRAYPAVVLAAGLLLAWRFGRPRIALSLLIFALADRALYHLPATDPAVAAAAVLVPVNVAGLTLLRLRSLLAPEGLVAMGVLAAQTLVVLVLRDAAFADLAAGFAAPVLPAALTGWTPVAPPALVAFAAALAAVGLRAAVRPDPQDRGFLWALVAAFVAFHLADPLHPALRPPLAPLGAASFWLGTAGLVLVVATVEASHALAYRDGLTGLPGRRAFDEALARLAPPWTVALVDIDHFKAVNDTHGHDVGDQVLRMVAGELARAGGGTRPFRYGGEEFALLFPGRRATEVEPHLEATRTAIERATFVRRAPDRPRRKPDQPRRTSTAGRELGVTVSIGYADAAVGGTGPAAAVVEAADQALYAAKRKGRNRVVKG